MSEQQMRLLSLLLNGWAFDSSVELRDNRNGVLILVGARRNAFYLTKQRKLSVSTAESKATAVKEAINAAWVELLNELEKI